MTLEQLALLSQVISAVAVIASLIFVGHQLRQGAKAARASSSMAHSQTYHAIINVIMQDHEFARIWHKALENPASVSEVEWVRVVAYLSALFRFYESSRVLWMRGQLDEEHWQNIEQQAINLGGQPGVQAWWEIRRHWHSRSFRDWFEALPVEDATALYGLPAKTELRDSR
jgi:hypothetical protein